MASGKGFLDKGFILHDRSIVHFISHNRSMDYIAKLAVLPHRNYQKKTLLIMDTFHRWIVFISRALFPAKQCDKKHLLDIIYH